MTNILKFEPPGTSVPIENANAAEPAAVLWRDRSFVKRDIEAHIAARRAYQHAVSWLAAAEAENLSSAAIEAARADLMVLYAEMIEAARCLVVVMPTDLAALCDLTMYLEKNFTTLPAEVSSCGGTQSLAFNLLRTTRLSLRHVAKYGKFKGSRD